jgi:6-phosphogluconolactonase
MATAGEPGPHKAEQASSHPHDVVFDPSGRFVLVADKGLDRIFGFRFDTKKVANSLRPRPAPSRHAAAPDRASGEHRLRRQTMERSSALRE